MNFAVGALVRVRGREWTVLPASTTDLLVVRPLGGTDDEIAGIVTALEAVTPATFAPPDPALPGDDRSAGLVRDAIRLGLRSSAGPFRSFARLGVMPRPYQLVPLLMALKLPTVRLLIADDVGIGKTIEAGMIARELLDRGEITRLSVLCPPPLAEQWQAELHDKFHIAAELVVPGTVARLERGLRADESLFNEYPYTIVSLDYIKAARHRDAFLQACPEFVIVDEAHTCATAGAGRGAQHQRHQLVVDLARDPARHMVCVTATPHSGDEGAFRSLIALLRPDFADLPEDLSGAHNERQRRELAAHIVQRRRGDIRDYLNDETPFPQRQEHEDAYALTPAYRAFVADIVAYARELVRDQSGQRLHQRVRWWSALALLRSVASSPAAAAATLRNRASYAVNTAEDVLDALARRAVLDLVEDDSSEGSDLAPPGDAGDALPNEARDRRRLLAFAAQADGLVGALDAKLALVVRRVKELIRDDFQPIIFCRFIPTAEYVKDALRQALPASVAVAAVTGLLPPAEREARVAELAAHAKRVLVCTDCLSEGINLQQPFNAVIHYDLSWNPTRHEQREGRVDRFGQPRPQVRVLTCYGHDNQIDGIVLDTLLRKHQRIRNKLGISVPVPADTNQVMEAVFEGLLLREGQQQQMQRYLPGLELPEQARLFAEWDQSAEREQRTRTVFAQRAIDVAEVRNELDASQAAIGGEADVARFTRAALGAYGVPLSPGDAPLSFAVAEVPAALRDTLGDELGATTATTPRTMHVRFTLPVADGERYLSRTHPLVERLAAFVMDQALDDADGDAAAAFHIRRAGVIRTDGVATRTTLLLLRLRFHLITEYTTGEPARETLAEDAQLAAFEGGPETPRWLAPAAAERLLTLAPRANILPGTATEFLRRVTDRLDALRPQLEQVATERGRELLAAHERVRSAARVRGVLRQRVVPQTPVDVLAIAIYLPIVTGGVA